MKRWHPTPTSISCCLLCLFNPHPILCRLEFFVFSEAHPDLSRGHDFEPVLTVREIFNLHVSPVA